MMDKISFPVNSVAASTAKTQSETSAAQLAEGFGQFLNDAVNKLNTQQAEADKLNVQFLNGELADVHQLMIAGQKVSLGLDLTLQIRNKVIEAYQEVMRTQI